MYAPNYEKIKHVAHEVRMDIVHMIHAAGSGHPGGSLGMTDVFSTLYFSGLLSYDPHSPKAPNRDMVILSNAHIAPVYYAILAHAGYFDVSELQTLRRFGSRLQGHPSNHFAELGIETSGGPLGQGMSVAVGFALSLKRKEDSFAMNRRVFCFCSDGELNEGQSWEAIMSASKYQLNNLIFIIDRNNIQIDGDSTDIMPLEPLHEKLKNFGCEVIDVDGHNIDKIYSALKYAKNKASEEGANHRGSNKPTALIMHTIPGKGVDFMENNYRWHGKGLGEDEFKTAIEQLS